MKFFILLFRIVLFTLWLMNYYVDLVELFSIIIDAFEEHFNEEL